MGDISAIQSKEQFDEQYFVDKDRRLGIGGFGEVFPVLYEYKYAVAAIKYIVLKTNKIKEDAKKEVTNLYLQYFDKILSHLDF